MEDLVFNVEDQIATLATAFTYVLDADDVAVGAGKTAVVTITTPAKGVTYTVSSRTFSFDKDSVGSTGLFEVSGTLADGTADTANKIPFTFFVRVNDPLTVPSNITKLVEAKDATVRVLSPLYLKTEALTDTEKATVLEAERKLEGLDRILDHIISKYRILV